MASVIIDLRFWAKSQFNAMVEAVYIEDYILINKTFKRMQDVLYELADRIMYLNEDNATALQSIATAYKSLFTTITASVQIDSNTYTAAWNGTSWETQYSDISIYAGDIDFDIEDYMQVVNSVLDYEKQYGSKKNTFSADYAYIPGEGEYYWEGQGDKSYLPAYTNIIYYSHIEDNDQVVNTKEFAFHISVCGTLKEGDKIELRIQNPTEPTYKVGDITYLPIYEGSNLQLTGGIDGNDTYKWQVKGTVNTFTEYLLNRTNPQIYSNNGLTFQIIDGVIPFQIGDVFKFSLESGNWKWRRDGGSWSNLLPIAQSATAMDRGLSVKFNFGVAPSFLPNDTYKIVAIQSNKVLNITRPDMQRYKGNSNIEIDLGSNKQIDTILIAEHNFTSNIQVIGSQNSDYSDPVFNVDIANLSIACRYFTSKQTVRYIKITNTGNRYIGYVFIGNTMRLSLDADNISVKNIYDMAKTIDYSILKKRKRSFDVKYSSFILRDDFELIEAMIHYLKDNNDLPMYFIPNLNYTDDIARVIIDTDNIDVSADIDYSAPKENRIYNLTIPLIER